MEKKQTAVQWLFKHARLDMSIYDWLLAIEYAEKMEKEQIEEAFNNSSYFIDGKEYYDKTYGN
jgi:hypothetical protein